MDSYVSSLTHSLELHGKNPELNLEHSTCVKGGLTLGLNLAPSPPPPPPPQKLASYPGPLGWGHNRENFGEVGQDVTAHLILKLWHLQ